MLANSDYDYANLETDLQNSEITIHYHESGFVKEEGISRFRCPGPHVQIVARYFVEVTQCDCNTCRFSAGNEQTTKSIPVEDILEVVVDRSPTSNSSDSEWMPYPVARWLRNSVGKLLRVALE